jgi:4-amino-4-deoxy-L-arabinose transferase-like glycosyltransferase
MFLIALAVRVAAILGRPHLRAGGDVFEYWMTSNFVAEGKGWIEPIMFLGTGVKVQTAKLPPLYTMLMIPCSLVGFKSYFAHRIWTAFLSALAAPVAATLGRRVGGPVVGLVAALGVGLYPNLWMPAQIGMSESISPILALLVLLAAYRMWEHPTVKAALALGVAIGFAALARDEMVVFAAFILLPLVIMVARRQRSIGEASRLLGVGLLGVLVVVSPWVGFNMARFSRPVLITDRLGATLASANCPSAWNGPFAGYWYMPCAIQAETGARGDESARDAVATTVALHYIGRHVDQLPRVELDRLGRTFAFWQVGQQTSLDTFVDGRPKPWVQVGLWSYYGLLVLAPIGLVRLRRAGVPTFPLWAVLGDVVLVVLVTYGQTRFRATLEPVLVLLGAVALCGAARISGSGSSSEESHRVQGSAVPRELAGPAAGGLLHAPP